VRQDDEPTMPPDDPGSFSDYLRTVIDALPEPAPPYCLIGALAVNAWGRLRTTKDIDLLVLSDETAKLQLTDSLVAHGFQPDARWIEHNPMAKDRVLRMNHPAHPGIPLDLIFSADSHEAEVLTRRQSMHLLHVPTWVCSPEDLIILKLKASRPHDFEDALAIVKNPHLQLDLPYLWNWVDRLGLQGELQYVFQAADGGGHGSSQQST
jgi:hypothetical protein